MTKEEILALYTLDQIKSGVRFIIEESEKHSAGLSKANISLNFLHPEDVIEHLEAVGYFERYPEVEEKQISIKLPKLKKTNNL
jgi:hypothetical protein